jgi:AcrR family transcriptional regulator
MLDDGAARTRVLDTAEDLFYRRGIQAVGMDELRAGSGLSLKRLYQLFPGKNAVVRAFLQRRDTRWRSRVAAHVEACGGGPDERILAVFDWLHGWFTEPGYRGCAFVNSFAELGGTSPEVAAEARAHKGAFKEYLVGLVTAAGRPTSAADHIELLAEGAMTVAAISGSAEPALRAREAALALLSGGFAVGAPAGQACDATSVQPAERRRGGRH